MYQNNGYNVSIDHVLEVVKTYIKKPESIELIKSAFEFANQKHQEQYRKSGEPYIIHPIEVAYILATWQTGPKTIASGFLHDIVEDTDITKEEFRQAVEYCVRIQPQLEKVITHEVPLSGSDKVFDMMTNPEEGTIKIVVDCTKA